MSRQFRSDDTYPWPFGFGSGKDGALVISSNTTFNPPRAGFSGSNGAVVGVQDSAASGLANGDLVIIHQTRGGATPGTWELNQISSGAGTVNLTLTLALQNTYTDSGDGQAQIMKLYEYTSVTVNPGITWTAPAWDGNTGGFISFLANGLFSTPLTGAIEGIGATGVKGTTTVNPPNGGGYRGGTGRTSFLTLGQSGTQGEGNVAAPAQSTAANGNGGGAGTGDDHQGGSGGYGTAGRKSPNTGGTQGGANGEGGMIAGNEELTVIFPGGGGGGGTEWGVANVCSSGSNGGAFGIFIARNIEVLGPVRLNGGVAVNENEDGKGVGAPGGGGAALFKGQNVNIGEQCEALGGGDVQDQGRPGGVGRFAIEYLLTYEGESNPAANIRQDNNLRNRAGGVTGFLV